MALTSLSTRTTEVERLERQLAGIEVELEELERQRGTIKNVLERARQDANMCPKCGRDRDFLTDEGGYLAHVLEDPDDDALLEAGKPLFCPACGEVFLYKAAAAAPAEPVAKAKPVTAPRNGNRTVTKKRLVAVPAVKRVTIQK